ncbi:MAG: plastocyanin/azurin family copper-binding protein [Acidimicrobiia bacterium]
MSDDTEIEPTAEPESESGAGTAVAVAERPGALAVPELTETQKRAELRKDRILLPFLLPVGAILAVALFAINLSRIFLAASQGDSTPAVVAAIIVTLSILVGATVIAASPNLRTSSLVLAVCGIAALVLLSGSIVLGSAENKEVKSAEPPGPAINKLEVQASDFHFQAKNFDVPAGINEIDYVSEEGSHTLAFDEPQFSYVLLAAPSGKGVSKATFVDGQKYTIYCTIPGHRAQGMEATITVGKPGTGKPLAGTGTPSTTLAGPTKPTTPNGQSEVDPAAQTNNQSGN